MVRSLRYATGMIIGKNRDYLHYYKSMIKTYEKGLWKFDIREIVKNIKVDIPCPKYVCKKGYTRRLCLTVLDYKLFETQLSKYMVEIIIPLQEIRRNKILARKVWIEKYGFISKGTQYCIKARYKCKSCLNKNACAVTVKYNKNEPAMAKMARMFELLYGNFQGGYWEEMAS